MATTQTDRWKALDFGPPQSGEAEPDQPVLADYVADGHVAVITLNRPHADNAITTEMGAALTEILETIAVRPSLRVAIITGAGTRAFSVGSDLRQRKDMSKEDWLRQRQDFDRTLYTLRQLRKPIFAAVNGIAYGGGSETPRAPTSSPPRSATFGQPRRCWDSPGEAAHGSAARLPRREGAPDADDWAHHRCRGAGSGWPTVHPQASHGRGDAGCREDREQLPTAVQAVAGGLPGRGATDRAGHRDHDGRTGARPSTLTASRDWPSTKPQPSLP